MIFATNNLDKLKQLKDLAPMLNIVGLKEYGIDIDIEEDGKTLEENAIKKALTIYNQTKQSVVADDSGLFIDYFEGWPGVYTHRFIPNSTASERNQAIIEKMANLDDDLRGARVVCVLAVCDKEGAIFTFKGEFKCSIAKQEKGENFFGFDSITLLPDGRTVAELTDQEKEKVNARSMAFEKLIKAYKNNELNI